MDRYTLIIVLIIVLIVINMGGGSGSSKEHFARSCNKPYDSPGTCPTKCKKEVPKTFVGPGYIKTTWSCKD